MRTAGREGRLRGLTGVAVSAALCLLLCGSAAGATLEPIGKFGQPVSVTSDPANAERLLIANREGVVDQVLRGAVTQFADLGSLVACCESERGLLSIVPAPDFASSGRFYAAYTGRPAAGGAEGDVHVDSFRPGPGGGAPLREPILSIGHSQAPSHNGGQLQFGPDGHLYISVGDGGGQGDTFENGQNTETLLGKILRIDPRPGQSPAYSIPPDNPFVGGPGRDEIWALGLRNPWRFSFDRLSGDMVIGDVGQGVREEVDFALSPGDGAVGGSGANYGWNCREGLIPYPEPEPACGSAGAFTDPVFDYPHADPGDGSAHGCSIIGGYVVRDPSLAGLYGHYVYSDYCSDEIRSLALPSAPGDSAGDDRSEGFGLANPTSFGEDACGRLYETAADGSVSRLVGGPSPADCPLPAVAEAAVPGLAATLGSPRRPRPRPRLRLDLRAQPADGRLKIVARVVPCAGHAGDRVQLNRGGERLRSGRLGSDCAARFFVTPDRVATFRVLLPGGETIRSRRLRVKPRSFG